MAFSVDEFKALVSKDKGLAMANLYMVTLPSLEGAIMANGQRITGYDAREINLLCSATSLPGRQILSTDRQIGMTMQKIAYGYAVPDVNLTFNVTNSYKIRTYFERWQQLAVSNNAPYELGFNKNYVKPVTIHQLRKGDKINLLSLDLGFDLNLPSQLTDALPTWEVAGFGVDLGDLAGGNLKLSKESESNIIYSCTLEDAYPTTLGEIALNNQPDTPIEFSVSLSYLNWTSSTPYQIDTLGDKVQGLVERAIDTIVKPIKDIIG